MTDQTQTNYQDRWCRVLAASQWLLRKHPKHVIYLFRVLGDKQNVNCSWGPGESLCVDN